MPTYRKTSVAWFCCEEDPRWELSNMAGGMQIFWPPTRHPANRWNSAEQLYQSSKYSTDVMCLPKVTGGSDTDPCVRNRIRAQKAPRGAKLTQKCAVAAGLVRADWGPPHEIRLKAMLWVLELKLFWNRSSFGEVLESTKDQPIVEISTKDDFWGCIEHPAGILVGANHLGLLLMQVRERIPTILRRRFTYPEGFLLP